MNPNTQDWHIYKATGQAALKPSNIPEAPPWRRFSGSPDIERESIVDTASVRKLGGRDLGAKYKSSPKEIDMVNAALLLRRPLLITGKPGTGKSSLAYAVARELGLGPVLRWSITSRSTLQQGLYSYDAIGRLQETNIDKLRSSEESGSSPRKDNEIGDFIRLQPLGTALLPKKHPRVLLIDELDKSDIDLPNDLLNVFEEGMFAIPELERLYSRTTTDGSEDEIKPVYIRPYDSESKVPIYRGRIECNSFPFIVITTNGEREFSGPFLRRCLSLTLRPPDKERLTMILDSHFNDEKDYQLLDQERREDLVNHFLARGKKADLATDQLMNAMFLIVRGVDINGDRIDTDEQAPGLDPKYKLVDLVLKSLNEGGS